MRLAWFTGDWFKRWGAPIALAAAATGAIIGSGLYRADAEAYVNNATRGDRGASVVVTQTVTATPGAPAPRETRVVERTVTLTARTPPPVTVVREAPPETVASNVGPKTVTTTVTETESSKPEAVLEALMKRRGKQN